MLSADAVAYSRLMGQDESRTVNTLKASFEVMDSLIGKFRGRVVDVHGDNLLAEFASVVSAVQCAVEIQNELNARNEEAPEASRMFFRIGINLGDVLEEDGKIYGDGVNVAARLESLADAGGICISQSVHDHVRNKLSVGYQSLGKHRAKNMAEPLGAHRVLMRRDAAGEVLGESRDLWKFGRGPTIAKAVITVLSVAAGIGALWTSCFRAGPPPVAVASVERMAFPLPDKPSIVVLPFENMTGDPNDEYFADGFTQQIISALAKISSLFVISRNSSFTYKGKPVRVQQVSEELGIRYVLEGSIQKAGYRIRINAQLIDAISGRHLWAERYDRSATDAFALQDEITLKILTALQVHLTSGEQARVWAKGTKNLEAYLKLMQVRENLYRMNAESNLRARRLAEETIALDPMYAEAYGLMGATYLMDVWLGSSRSPKGSLEQAMEWTQKALALDNTVAAAHARLGYLHVLSRRHEEGTAEAAEAVTMEPNSAHLHHILAMVLRFSGRSGDAIPVSKNAIRLEPFAPANYYENLGLAYLLTGDCEEALKACKKGLERETENLMSYVMTAAAYGSCGKEEEARRTAQEVRRLSPKFSSESFGRILPYKKPSDRDRILEGLRKAGL